MNAQMMEAPHKRYDPLENWLRASLNIIFDYLYK